ncbi:MAG: PaaI family thioesterase [Sedimentisphaeraceae bacterium JB056]
MKAEEYAKKDAYAAHNGVELLEAKEGSAKAKLFLKEYHLNGMGITHGAALFTLADFTFGAAANSHEYDAVTINVHMSFLKSTKAGDTLYCEATEINLRGRVGSYHVQITDADGQVIAIFEGLAYRKF